MVVVTSRNLLLTALVALCVLVSGAAPALAVGMSDASASGPFQQAGSQTSGGGDSTSSAPQADTDAEGRPDFSASVSEGRVQAGQTTALQVTLTNTGRITDGASNPQVEREVTTARGVSARLDAGDAPLSVRTGDVSLGTLPDGTTTQVPFQVRVDEDAEPGTYEVDVVVEYRYTSEYDASDGDRETDTRTETMTVEVEVTESADFEVVDVRSDVAPGESGDVTFVVENTGSETVTDAAVSIQSSNAALSFGGAQSARVFVGEWEPGERKRVTVEGTLAPGAEDRSYAVDLTVNYTTPDGQQARSATLTAGVTPSDSQQFDIEVVDVDSGVNVGDSGNVTYTLRNTGSEDLQRAAVTLDSPNAALNFGGAQSARVYVGDWAAGDTKRFTVEAGTTPGAEQRAYAVDLTVGYTTESGESGTSDTLTTGITPNGEQDFDVADTNVSLRVGEDGTIEGTVVNRGPNVAENAVLVLQPTSGSLDVSETEYAVGTLRPGEGAPFSYDVSVADGAGAAPRQFTVQVRYEGTDGATKQSDPLYVRGDVGPARDEFTVEPVNATVEAGGTTQVTLRVTNNGEERLTDISAKLFGDDPVSIGDSEAFVTGLDPGESAEMEFRVSAAEGAIEKTYPVSVDFQYDDADGDTMLSDTYRVPIEVTEGEDGGLLQVGWLPVGLLTVLMLGIGYVVISRR